MKDRPHMHNLNLQSIIFYSCLLSVCNLIHPMKDALSGEPSRITPLHRAAFEGHEEAVESLLKMGADAHARNCYGRTPLHDAVHFGSPYIVSLLLKHKGNTNAVDNYDMTPLFKAVENNNIPVIKLLLEHGADANQTVNGISPLHKAAYNSNLEAIRLLLAHGAAINAQNIFGRTPLHDVFEGHGYCPDVVRLLLEANANVTIKDKEGVTPLHAAVRLGDLAARCVKLLLTHGANPNIYVQGYTPLHHAAFNANCRITELLCKYSAHIDAKNCFGKTPLHDALDTFYSNFPSHTATAAKSVIEVLIKNGAHLDIADNEGRTPQAIIEHDGILNSCIKNIGN